jgi:MerR family transcriptional regulator, light-induced transcriptional regulator
LRTLKTSEAAALLNVTPNTLRTWERRFGYPKPQRLPGKHRLYAYAEIAALREALEEGLTISSAVSVVSEAFGAEAHAVLAALGSFRADQADEAMEGSLALRSLERSVQEVLLPALDEVRRRKGAASAAWGFAAPWGNDWLRRAQRMAPATPHPPHVLIGDATNADLDPAAAYMRALVLCCARQGMSASMLPVCAFRRLGEAVEVFHPKVVVIAGGHSGDEEVARWAYAVRTSAGCVQFVLYHRGLEPVLGGARARILPFEPTEAQRMIAQMLHSAPTPIASRTQLQRVVGRTKRPATTALTIVDDSE